MKVRFLDDAENELVASIEYYEKQVTGLGIDFYEEVRKATEVIQASPLVWHVKRYKCRSYLVLRFPFLLYYYIKNETIWIVAVAHTSRKPFYWRKRVKEMS